MKKKNVRNKQSRKYNRCEHKKIGNLDCHKKYTVCNNQEGPFGIIKFHAIPDDLKRMRKQSVKKILDTIFKNIKSDSNILNGSAIIIYLFDNDGSHDIQFYGIELTNSRNYILTSNNITKYYPSELTDSCLGVMYCGLLDKGLHEFAISVGTVYKKIGDEYKYPLLMIKYCSKNDGGHALAVEFEITGDKITFGKKRYVNF